MKTNRKRDIYIFTNENSSIYIPILIRIFIFVIYLTMCQNFYYEGKKRNYMLSNTYKLLWRDTKWYEQAFLFTGNIIAFNLEMYKYN